MTLANRRGQSLDQLRNKSLAILGAGREGLALADYLHRHKLTFSICDQRGKQSLGKTYDQWAKRGVSFHLGGGYLNKLDDFDVVFRSPGIPWLTDELAKARDQGVTVTSATRLFFDLCPAITIGVSGTKGKGTTASWLTRILQRAKRPVQLGGNIGRPAISFVDSLTKDDLVVLELSSFQLQDLERSPHLAILTNLTTDHLDHHRSVTEYHRAKSSLVRFQKPDDLAILNADDGGAKELAEVSGGRQQWFSHRREVIPGAFVDQDKIVLAVGDKRQIVCEVRDIAVPGPHNLDNVLAAILAAHELGVDLVTIHRAIRTFRALPHHLEVLGQPRGIAFVNDSYATNPTATIPALQSFDQPVILICGGYDKGLDYQELGQAIVQRKVKGLVLIEPVGRTIGAAVATVAQASGQPVPPTVSVSQKERILPAALKYAQSGDVVLFSPAAASFGMFDNYVQRGKFFAQAVDNL